MKPATKAALVSTVVVAMALVNSTSSFAIRVNAQKKLTEPQRLSPG
jgi:hypothetical protein